MVYFKTFKTIQLGLATHIWHHLGARHGRPGITKHDAVSLADNPIIETANDGSDYLWFIIVGGFGTVDSYRFGYNASALFPTVLKLIQKLDPVSNTWQHFWKDES